MTPKKPRKFTPRQEASSAETAPERLKELADDPKLARLVAANSNAPAELLLELSRNDDKAVRKACTSNANTPVEALLKLGAQFPEQLLENPVFDLLLLAHPGVFEDLPTATLNSLLKRNQVPVELIRWAWKHRGESTLQSLLMNPNTPADVVEELCKSKDPEVQIAAELHCTRELPGWAKDVQNGRNQMKGKLANRLEIKSNEKWLSISEAALQCIDRDFAKDLVSLAEPDLRIQLAKLGLPNPVLNCLAQYPEARRTIANNKHCPQELLDILAKDQQSEIRSDVALSPQTRPGTLVLLAKDPARNVRQSVARNRATPDDCIKVLAQDPDWRVRENIASREDLNPSEIQLLARDRNEHVRAAMASTTCCSVDVLELLADDKESLVRSCVARNHNSGQVLLDRLAKECDWDVLRALVDNGNTPAGAWMRAFRTMRTILDGEWERNYREGLDEIHPFAMIVDSPSIPPRVLKELISEDDYQVRKGIASSKVAPQDILAILSNDEDELVRRAVALNQNTSQAVLEVLARDKDECVRSGVACNQNASIDILTRLSKDNSTEVRGALSGSPYIAHELVRRLAYDSDWWVRELLAVSQAVHGRILDFVEADEGRSFRALIAGNALTHPDILKWLSNDSDPDVRASVAINPNTPKDALLALASDLDTHVNRSLAKRNDLDQGVVEILLAKSDYTIAKALLSSELVKKDQASSLLCELFANLLKAACNGSAPSPGRRFLFTLPQCPANLLAKNFRSRNWLERFAIAGNPSTPEAVVERMAKEGNQLVRRAAAENLARRASAPNQQLSHERSSP